MTDQQAVILLILAATIFMFVWGRWRHDVVAGASLLACVLAGLVPAEAAFAGFGHAAVITVASVLVLSRGLQNTGAVDALAKRTLPSKAGPTLTIAALTGLGAIISSFMNNVGAMALLMPVAVQVAARHELPAGKVLMPLAFGTILGGMVTLIGTPPNLIVSGFRAEADMGSFGMFDFTPVGLTVACAGVAFVVLLGWRIVPARKQQGAAGFDTGTYLTEARVTDEGKAVGKPLREVARILEEADAQIIGMIRNEVRFSAPNPARVVRSGDILVIEAEPDSLGSALSALGLTLEKNVLPEPEQPEDDGSRRQPDAEPEDEQEQDQERESSEPELQELVVMPTSALIGRSASSIRLQERFGLNLLAISRQGRRTIKRLRSTPIQGGDVLLMQGVPDGLSGFAAEFGCVPLAPRAVRIPASGRLTMATVIMAAAIGGAALGLLPAAIAFAGGVLLFTIFRVVPVRQVYEAIDWPIVVLLGALIPIAGAMASTGAADLLAQVLLDNVATGRPVVALAIVLVTAMTLSDFMNNAATAAVMCPISISTAAQLGVSADSFLMAVAIGASCAFLTPIGHQNNTLILGPGGFRFGDYWRLGLPLEILVIAVSLPMLLVVWPL